MPEFVCANCGRELEKEVYVCLDNFLQVKYFDNNKCNRFCSQECFCESLFLEPLEPEEVPLDYDEQHTEEMELLHKLREV